MDEPEEKSAELLELEQNARGLASALRDALPDRVGFTLLLFDYGDSGWMTYISSAERATMIETMEGTLKRLKERTI